jgi:hypothetical protein
MIDGVIYIIRRRLIFYLQPYLALAGKVKRDEFKELLHIYSLPVPLFDRVCGLRHVDFQQGEYWKVIRVSVYAIINLARYYLLSQRV